MALNGCTILNCPAYQDGRCIDSGKYIDADTGQPSCPFHPNAVPTKAPSIPTVVGKDLAAFKRGMEHLESITIDDDGKHIGVIDVWAADPDKGATLGALLAAAPRLYIACRLVYTYLTHTADDANSLYDICMELRDAIDLAESDNLLDAEKDGDSTDGIPDKK